MDGIDPPSPPASYSDADNALPGPVFYGLSVVQGGTLPHCPHRGCMELAIGDGTTPLGVGRTAVVYPASFWGTAVAAKVVPDAAADASATATAARRALNNELLQHRSLRHDNIVAYRHYAHLPARGVHVLLTRRAHGGTIADLLGVLDGGGYTLHADAFLSIALQLMTALQYLHAVGLVHNDVTPSNVLLSAAPERDGRGAVYLPPGTVVVLADFGACERFRARGEIGMPSDHLIDADGREQPSPTTADLLAAGMVLQALLLGGPADAIAVAAADAVGAPAGTPVWPAPSSRWASSRRCHLAVTLPAAVALTSSLQASDPVARPTASRAYTLLATAAARQTAVAACGSPPRRGRWCAAAAAASRWGAWAAAAAPRVSASSRASSGGSSSLVGSSGSGRWPATPEWATDPAPPVAPVPPTPPSTPVAGVVPAADVAAAMTDRVAPSAAVLSTVAALAGLLRNRWIMLE